MTETTRGETISSTTISERIPSLDFLRGIAILGILFINAENFAYPDSWSPWKFGFEESIDLSTRFWVYFLTQGKFYTMFALLFGVGFYIFLERLERKRFGLKAMDIFARRLLWLFVIGVLHAYLVWDGDVLYHYAICGFLLLPFRSISSRNLIFITGLLASIMLIDSYEKTTRRIESFNKYGKALALPIDQRNAEDEKRASYWENYLSKKESDTTFYVPKKGTYISGLEETYRHASVHKGQWYHKGLLFRSLIVMIVGIIFYRSGIFRDYRVWKRYWLITISAISISLIINYYRFHHWTFEYNQPVLNLWQDMLFTFPKELLGVSYVLVLNGIYQQYLRFSRIKLISKIGRMALTNYIFQNILLGLVFYGYGLGQFNQFSRFDLIGIVLAIWVVQMTLSWLWLRKYKQGPLEAIWRKLTYSSFKGSSSQLI